MTYLELCQHFVQEIGVAGGGSGNPAAVTGQTGELLNIVTWIREAEFQINNQAKDWKYLWAPYSQALAISDQLPTMPSSPRAKTWRKQAFWLDKGGVNQKKLAWMGYDEFSEMTSTPSTPQRITITPAGQLTLDAPMTQALTLTGQYYKAPTLLAAGADVSPIPEDFHRAIFCRAAVIYGGREDAPEIVNHYEPEYLEIMSHLDSDQRAHREQEDDPEAYDHIDQCIPGIEDSFGGFATTRS